MNSCSRPSRAAPARSTRGSSVRSPLKTGTTTETPVLLVQALLVGGGVFPCALFARRLFGPRAGLLGAAAYALDPYSKRYASLVLAEALAGFLLLVAAYAFVRAWQERSLRWWAGC